MPTDSELTPRLEREASGFDWWSGVYGTEVEDLKVKIIFERMTDGDNGAIWSEARALIVSEEHDPITVIPPSRTNLMNATKGGSGWKGLAQTLGEMASVVKWDAAVAQGVEQAIEVYRNGETETALRTGNLELGHPFLLEPFVATSGVSVFYGEGGTGKSLLALGMAVAVAGDLPVFGQYPRVSGPVVYFDYEDDSSVHEERLTAILSSLKVDSLKHPIWHRSLVAKVSQSQATMRRTVQERGAVMAVLDSIGMGRGGNANTAEDTVRMFRALRSLDVPTLAIDHVNKEDKRSGEVASPYGSVYTINSARLLWGAVAAPAMTTETKKFLNLTNTKANRVALHPPMGISVAYQNQRDDTAKARWLDKVDFAVMDEWWSAKEPDTWAIIEHYMEQHPIERYSITELAMFLDMPRGTVEKAMQRNARSVVKEKRGREYVYGLILGNNVTELHL